MDHVTVVDDQHGYKESRKLGRAIEGVKYRADRSEKGRMTLLSLVIRSC